MGNNMGTFRPSKNKAKPATKAVAPVQDPSPFANIDLILDTMRRMKIVMKKKNLRAARARCPREGCGGVLHATLNGPKDHLHMRCDTAACPIRMME